MGLPQESVQTEEMRDEAGIPFRGRQSHPLKALSPYGNIPPWQNLQDPA